MEFNNISSKPPEKEGIEKTVNSDSKSQISFEKDYDIPHIGYEIDHISNLLKNNTYLLRERIKCLREQINQRQSLVKDHQYNIMQKVCDLESQLYSLKKIPGQRFDPVISKQTQSLESELNSLEKEKRNVESSSWKDISKLYLDLNNTILEYKAAKEKEQFGVI